MRVYWVSLSLSDTHGAHRHVRMRNPHLCSTHATHNAIGTSTSLSVARIHAHMHTRMHTHTQHVTHARNLSHIFYSPTLPPSSNALNLQPVLHPVLSGTQSPSSASRMATASSLVGWQPPLHPPVVDFALHVVKNVAWILRDVRRGTGSHCQYLSLPPWMAPADGWIIGGLSSPLQDGYHRAEGGGGGGGENLEELRA